MSACALLGTPDVAAHEGCDHPATGPHGRWKAVFRDGCQPRYCRECVMRLRDRKDFDYILAEVIEDYIFLISLGVGRETTEEICFGGPS